MNSIVSQAGNDFSTTSKKGFLILFLTTALILTGAVFFWFVLDIYQSRYVHSEIDKKILKISELRGAIINLDEILSMSARMSATTGDSEWEKRYREFEPKLNQAIEEVRTLTFGSKVNQNDIQTNAAKLKLVEMENRAFASVREGRADNARRLLFSDEYAAQKKIYADGMQAFDAELKNFQEAQLNNNDAWLIALVMFTIVFSLLAWLATVRSLFNSHKNLLFNVAEKERAAEALRQSETRFRQLFENANDIIFTVDLQGNFTSINRVGEDSTGFTRDDVLKMNFSQIVAPESLELVNRMLSEKVGTAAPTKYETEIVTQKGDRLNFEVNSRLIVENGKAIGVQGIARDVTESRQATENKRKSEQYQNLFKHANDAILIFETGSELVLEVNDKACEIYGRRREDFVGRSLKEMSQNVNRGTEELQKLLHDGVYQEFESVHLRGDGTPFNLVINAAVIEYQGSPAILTINRDVTARKRIQEDLRESEEQFRSVTRSAQDAIVSSDSRGNIVFWNAGAEKIFGYAEQEVLGKSLQMIMPVVRRQSHQTGFERSINTGENRLIGKTVEVSGRRKDGSEFPLEVSLGTWESAKGKFFTAVLRDITERKRAEEQLRQSEQWLRATLDASRDGIVIEDNEEIVYINKSYTELLGYDKPDELVGRNISELLSPNEAKRLSEFARRRLRGEQAPPIYEFAAKHKDGTQIEVEGAVSTSVIGGKKFIMTAIRDITERKRAEEQLQHDAFHDGLTGLANRTLFTHDLQMTIERGKRGHHALYAVLFLDFDRFKFINDSLGHTEGDNFLKLAARRLEFALRTGDLVARIGGDEFTILLTELDDESDAVRIVERIQEDLKIPFELGGREIFASVSIGIAFGGNDYEQAGELLRDADIAMYRAKAKGRARYQVFDRSMHELASKQLQLETEMRHALEREEFLIHYQPIMNLETETLMGFEALVRWKHQTRGIIPPVEFIGAAEENNLILPLGQWILRESCRQMRLWQDNHPAASHLTVSVNLSCKQFSQIDLAEQIAATLGATGLEPRCLKLEITESHLMENSEAAIMMLNRLRSLGVELSLDDFGTGYSSLSYLHRLPVSYLKVDRSFVMRMLENEENDEIVSTIIKLAQNLKMKVVAEGIETAEQLAHLKILRCEYGQGFFFSKALEAAAAGKFIEENAGTFLLRGSQTALNLEFKM